ncbi:hypothetical protein RRG08_062204 [Elysia crispata]|uniref:Uncharacterized protein n=1 Tax=Elysia crispata TaxID=231223 RepID=A0AAE0YA16_9GAST|nr:hypothetical protein RRG08_062204 [Elysia crispata]
MIGTIEPSVAIFINKDVDVQNRASAQAAVDWRKLREALLYLTTKHSRITGDRPAAWDQFKMVRLDGSQYFLSKDQGEADKQCLVLITASQAWGSLSYKYQTMAELRFEPLKPTTTR